MTVQKSMAFLYLLVVWNRDCSVLRSFKSCCYHCYGYLLLKPLFKGSKRHHQVPEKGLIFQSTVSNYWSLWQRKKLNGEKWKGFDEENEECEIGFMLCVFVCNLVKRRISGLRDKSNIVSEIWFCYSFFGVAFET